VDHFWATACGTPRRDYICIIRGVIYCAGRLGGPSMLTIDRRPMAHGPRHRVRVRFRSLHPQTRTFPTLTLARQWSIAMEHAGITSQGLPMREAQRYTLADVLHRYRLGVLLRLSPGTHQNRAIHLVADRVRISPPSRCVARPTRLYGLQATACIGISNAMLSQSRCLL
jgi:hypothetical protein